MPVDADPLDSLYTDQTLVDRALLARLLTKRVRLDRSGRFFYEPGVKARLQGEKVVIIALLARKALSLNQEGFAEAASPKELEELTGVGGGTLRPILKRLADKQLVIKSEAGYLVPNHVLAQLESDLDSESV